MKYDLTLRKLWKITPDYESRYVLSGFYLDCDRRAAVATDGHCLAVIDATGLIEEGEKSFLIPIDALKAADKLFTKVNDVSGKGKKGKAPAAFPVYIRASDDCITISSPMTKRSYGFDMPKGSFPAWSKVIPEMIPTEADPWTAICIDAHLLARLAEALDGKRKELGVTLFVRKASEAIIIAAAGMRSLPSLGLLMPRRDLVEFPKPFWKTPPAEEKSSKPEPEKATA